MAQGAESIPNDVIELAYAEQAIRLADKEAQEAHGARRAAENAATLATQRASVAREALTDLTSKLEKGEIEKHEAAIIALLGLVDLDIARGESVIIEVTDEVAEEYRQRLVAEEERKRQTGLYKPQWNEEYSDFRLSLEGQLLDNKTELTPGTPFVHSSGEKFPTAKDDVMVVSATTDEGRAPVTVVFDVRKKSRSDELSWDLGLRINIEGQEEPYDHFHSAPIGFDIDQHIEDLINGHKKIMAKPVHDTHPLDPIALAEKLRKFKKTKLVKELEKRAEASLISAISGASYTTFPNETSEAPQYSEGRYVELLTELEKLGVDKLEAAIDARADRAVGFLRWQNDSVNRRPVGNYLNISQDTYEFVRGELLFRKSHEENPAPYSTDDFVDALAGFYKRGYRVRAAKEAVKKAAQQPVDA